MKALIVAFWALVIVIDCILCPDRYKEDEE